MFKKLIASLCILFAPLSFAQQEVPINMVCYDTDELLNSIQKKYKEEPQANFITNSNNMLLFINKQTQTWTIVAFEVETDISCVILAGIGIKDIRKKGNRV